MRVKVASINRASNFIRLLTINYIYSNVIRCISVETTYDILSENAF